MLLSHSATPDLRLATRPKFLDTSSRLSLESSRLVGEGDHFRPFRTSEDRRECLLNVSFPKTAGIPEETFRRMYVQFLSGEKEGKVLAEAKRSCTAAMDELKRAVQYCRLAAEKTSASERREVLQNEGVEVKVAYSDGPRFNGTLVRRCAVAGLTIAAAIPLLLFDPLSEIRQEAIVFYPWPIDVLREKEANEKKAEEKQAVDDRSRFKIVEGDYRTWSDRRDGISDRAISNFFEEEPRKPD